MESKIEKERKNLNDQLKTEVSQLEKEEEEKYEKKLDQMRREIQS
jgi:hypothetical protein